METIDIVVVTYLRFTLTRQCLEHVVNRTRRPYRLTLVVNGVEEHDRSEIDFYQELHKKEILDHLILLKKNYGIHAAKNVSLPLIHSEFYIDMDNDILVPDLTPDWTVQLENLIRDRKDEFGAISLRPQVLIGRSPKEFDGCGVVKDLPHVGGHGRIMNTSAVKAVDGWEKTWNAKRNHEEKYIAKCLKDLNLKVGYARDLRCYHLFGDGETSDSWGYPGDKKPEDHGHREIWPPAHKYSKFEDYDPITWEKK